RFPYHHPTPTQINTLSLHDALPISKSAACRRQGGRKSLLPRPAIVRLAVPAASRANRSWPKQAERCERARVPLDEAEVEKVTGLDRKSTRLNSSHVKISYAVFCLKK